MIVIDCAVESFADLWDSSPYSESIIAVADKNGNFILPQNLEYTEGLVEELQNFSEEGENLNTLRFDNQTWYVAVTKLNYIEGYVYQLVPITDALKNVAYVFLAVLAAVIFIGALLIFISAKISNTITQPINRLIVQMETVESGNLSLQPEVYHGEMQVLAEKFDHMVSQVHMMFEEVKETEKEKREMEMLALQAQINPHFLYNTFECIRSMALYYDVEDIAEITMALSNVFRFAVKAENIVTVEDEINYMREYAKIIDYRFMGKIEVHIDAEEEVLKKPVIKLMLQPLVENAVFHGLEQKIDEGEVDVSIRRTGVSHMLFVIEDNGCGIEPAKVVWLRNTLGTNLNRKGIGISNIYQRLKLFYEDDVKFEIKSKVGEGTRITIIIPDNVKEVGHRHA